MKTFQIQLILTAFHFVMGFLVVFITYQLLRKFFKLLTKAVGDTHTSGLGLFISFGIALLFFTTTFVDTIIKLGNFFIFPFKNTASISEIMNNHGPTYQKIFSAYLNRWAFNFNNFINENLFTLKFGSLFLFFTLWLLIALLLREMSRSMTSQNKEAEKTMATFFEKKIVQNILTLSIVFFSVYLSISSIIAVPEFQTLESSNDPTLSTNFKLSLENQRLYTKEDLMMPEPDDSLIIYPVDRLNYLREDLNNTITNYNLWMEKNWINDYKLRQAVVNRFQSALDQKLAPTNRAKYKLSLSDWYLDQHEKWILRASFHQVNLIPISKRINQYLAENNDVVFDTLVVNGKETLKAKLSQGGEISVKYLEEDLRNTANEYFKIYDAKYNISSIPEKPTIGEKFGIFNTISGWLLRTESLSLALIVGLFGFGLLGSIGSLFIRRRIREGYLSEPVVVFDIPGILINGMSAAIVIFLAVKGAVVIFSTDGDNLNPYVLFFTCLVASVFSEDVWGWARKKLNQNLGNEEKAESKNVNTLLEEE